MGPARELDVIALEPELERLVSQALGSPMGAVLDPGVAETLTREAAHHRQAPGRPGRSRPACWCPTPSAPRWRACCAAVPRA